MTQWTDKHYNNVYKLTQKDIEAGEIRVDAYFVAKQWKTGSKDDSGALFHILKTVARFGDKNDIEREVKALHDQALGVARSFCVEVEKTKPQNVVKVWCDTCEGIGHYDNTDLGLPLEHRHTECPCPDCDGNGYTEVVVSEVVSKEEQWRGIGPAQQSRWYPDDSGEWVEYGGSGQPVEGDVVVEVLLDEERDNQCWKPMAVKANEWYWGINACSAKIVAYKVVK